jgi:hypothetical protein
MPRFRPRLAPLSVGPSRVDHRQPQFLLERLVIPVAMARLQSRKVKTRTLENPQGCGTQIRRAGLRPRLPHRLRNVCATKE